MTPHLLVVDDDPEIARLLKRYLEGVGFRVDTAASVAAMESALASAGFDLVVLDVVLPDGSGLDMCRAMRGRGVATPVILLTALQEDVDRILGLEMGADDYLPKPFNPRELAARIRAVLRRTAVPAPRDESTAKPTALRFAGYLVEPDTRRVVAERDGTEVALTGAEFELLRVFLARPGRVLSRESLLDVTKGREADPFDRSIDVLVSRIRKKLGEAGGPILKTVRNGGYQFCARVEAAA